MTTDDPWLERYIEQVNEFYRPPAEVALAAAEAVPGDPAAEPEPEDEADPWDDELDEAELTEPDEPAAALDTGEEPKPEVGQ